MSLLMNLRKQQFSVDHVERSPNLTEIAHHNSLAHHATGSCMRTKKNNHFSSFSGEEPPGNEYGSAAVSFIDSVVSSEDCGDEYGSTTV